jgi:cytochrome c biogenesis protein CcdA
VTTNAEKVDRNALVFGAGIVLVELPTAIPYFAVIATVVGSDRAAATQVVLLAIFNLCFVLPLLGILALRTLAGERALGLLERIRARVDRWLATLAPGLVLLVGLVLVGIGAYGLLTD